MGLDRCSRRIWTHAQELAKNKGGQGVERDPWLHLALSSIDGDRKGGHLVASSRKVISHYEKGE